MEKRKGFTLIELLVVIAIISLLLAILIPSLKRTRNQAKAVVCQSNLRQWGAIFSMSADGNQGYFFFDVDTWLHGQDVSIFRNKKISFCPIAVREGDKQRIGTVNDRMFSGTLGSTFKSWSYDSNNVNISKGSYGYNVLFFDWYRLTDFYKRGWNYYKISEIYLIKEPYKVPILLDSAAPWIFFNTPDKSPAPTEEQETGCCINRHDGGVNSLFLDWSVRKVGLKELWKLKWVNQGFDTNGPWTLAGGVKPEDWPEWMRGFKDY